MYLFGASGHGKVIKEIIEACGGSVTAFVDDNKQVNTCAGLPVLHDANGLSPMIVSIGVCRIRKMIVERLHAVSETIPKHIQLSNKDFFKFFGLNFVIWETKTT